MVQFWCGFKVPAVFSLELSTVRIAECPLLTKLRQQRMLNEKQEYCNNIPLFTGKMQLKIIS